MLPSGLSGDRTGMSQIQVKSLDAVETISRVKIFVTLIIEFEV